jgi:hypothetical protein
MGYILKPANGDDLYVNKWNWHPTVELIEKAGLISYDRADRLHYNCGGDITGEEAVKIAEFLATYLASMTAGERLLTDGAVTSEPDTFEMFRGADWNKNYSATFEWLVSFRDFCTRCQGFSVL